MSRPRSPRRSTSKPDLATLNASLAHLREQGVRFVPLTSIRRREGNPRDNAESVPAMVASLVEFGWTVPITVDPSGEVEAGDTRWLAAAHLGLVEVPIVTTLHDDAKARRYVVADNRIGELASWNGVKLGAILEGFTPSEIAVTGFDAEEVAALARGPDIGDRDVKPENDDDDREPEARHDVPAITKLGDVWILGPHRIVCGDNGEEDTIARCLQGEIVDLFCSDPPFAIYGSSTGVSSSVSDDRMVVPFFEATARLAHRVSRWFGHIYIFCDWRSYPALREGGRRAELEPKNLLVWDKGNGGLGSNYANTHEFVAFFVKIPARTAMKGDSATGQRAVLKPNILRFQRATGAERPHNASKPVPLVSDLITNSTDVGAIVFDPFGGGGATLIACEKTGRVARLIDVSPAWVDVMVARWERVTGRKAVRIAAEDYSAGSMPANHEAPTKRRKPRGAGKAAKA